MKKRIISILIMSLALTACSSKPAGKEIETKDPSEYKAEEKEAPEYAVEGEVAPDITIKKLDDTEAVVSDYFGKPTIMTFWATWCGYCVSEMPGLQMLQDKYGDDINIIALNGGDDKETIEAFMEENGYTFEAAQVSIEDSLVYNAQSIPVTVILDKDGVIQFFAKGSLEGEEMFNKYFDPIFEELIQEAEEAETA